MRSGSFIGPLPDGWCEGRRPLPGSRMRCPVPSRPAVQAHPCLCAVAHACATVCSLHPSASLSGGDTPPSGLSLRALQGQPPGVPVPPRPVSCLQLRWGRSLHPCCPASVLPSPACLAAFACGQASVPTLLCLPPHCRRDLSGALMPFSLAGQGQPAAPGSSPTTGVDPGTPPGGGKCGGHMPLPPHDGARSLCSAAA